MSLQDDFASAVRRNWTKADAQGRELERQANRQKPMSSGAPMRPDGELPDAPYDNALWTNRRRGPGRARPPRPLTPGVPPRVHRSSRTTHSPIWPGRPGGRPPGPPLITPPGVPFGHRHTTTPAAARRRPRRPPGRDRGPAPADRPLVAGPRCHRAGLPAFIVYSTWRAFANADYYRSRTSRRSTRRAWRRMRPMRAARTGQPFGDWWPLSPALLILIFPLGFRLTCYYYRKAYYRAFWLSPPACAVAEPHEKYTGETRFPLILQNIHRYFFYVGAARSPSSSPGTRCSPSATSDGEWGHMGLGTLVLLVNVVADLGSTRCPATPAGTSSAAGSSTSPSTRCATGVELGRPSSTPGTCCWPGSRWSAWPHRLLHLLRGHRRVHRPADSSEMADRDVRDATRAVRRRRDRRRRRRSAGRDRGPRGGAADRDHLQVAVRQGPHGDGRGRHRRRHGQRQLRATTGRCTSATPCAAASS